MTRSAALLYLSPVLVAVSCAAAPGAHAQSARLSGRVLDAFGRPSSNAVVRLVSDTTLGSEAHPRRYTLLGDARGKFSQEGIAPGAYLVMLFTDGKGTDVLKRVSLKPGEAAVLNLTAGPQEATVEIAASSPLTPARQSTAAPTR